MFKRLKQIDSSVVALRHDVMRLQLATLLVASAILLLATVTAVKRHG